MGKGHNHHPACTCGWCTSTWGSHARYKTESQVKVRRPEYVDYPSGIPAIRPRYDSFTTPNASCPVCGATVFYYQSPYGGRVFFDALGPPWPKHPCTDKREHAKTMPRPISKNREDDTSDQDNSKLYRWQKDGWHPFFLSEVILTKSDRCFQLVGLVNGFQKVVYVKLKFGMRISKRMSLCFFSGNSNKVELSVYHRGKDIRIAAFYSFKALSMAFGKATRSSPKRPAKYARIISKGQGRSKQNEKNNNATKKKLKPKKSKGLPKKGFPLSDENMKKLQIFEAKNK